MSSPKVSIGLPFYNGPKPISDTEAQPIENFQSVPDDVESMKRRATLSAGDWVQVRTREEILRTLVKKADVFVTNFPGPIRDRLKLRPTDILSLNERIIYASLTPYGEEGPEKDRTGYDSTAWWARSGMMHAVRPTAHSMLLSLCC